MPAVCVRAALLVLFVFAVVPISYAQAQSSGLGSNASGFGFSNASNPGIGANFLFVGAATDANDEDPVPDAEIPNGLHVQEMEFSFAGAVDPYFNANLIVAIEGGEVFAVEEGYVTMLALPKNVGLTIGKKYAPFGKQNGLHTHAFAFIDIPLAHQRLLGEEGLNDVGVIGSYLLPAPWFSEVSVSVFNGGEESFFNSPDSRDMFYDARWYNQWDLTDYATIEAGVSYAGGASPCVLPAQDPVIEGAVDEELVAEGDPMATALAELGGSKCANHIGGLDLTYKNLPASKRDVVWSTEYLYNLRLDNGDEVFRYGGLESYIQYRFANRWYASGRVDVLGLPKQGYTGTMQPFQDVLDASGESDMPYRVSGLIAFVPTEFSAVRLQYSYYDDGVIRENRVMVQLNITLGMHPAHAY